MVRMDVASRLKSLVGRRSVYKVEGGPEVWCLILAIERPTRFYRETDLDEVEAAINQSLFTVRYQGALIGGSGTGVVLGRNLSRIEGSY